MKADALKERIVQLLDDAKAQNIVALNVSKISSIADYMVIATGTSSRHVAAVADRLIDTLKQEGVRAWGVEGQDTGEWALVDFGDVIVHVMQAETREFYQLEKLWSGFDNAAGDEMEPSVDQG